MYRGLHDDLKVWNHGAVDSGGCTVQAACPDIPRNEGLLSIVSIEIEAYFVQDPRILGSWQRRVGISDTVKESRKWQAIIR
jgi:hypothetical protein